MIRQRVDRHGGVYALEPTSQLASCTMKPEEVGIIKEGPVKKWMAAKMQWDIKYASAKRRVQRQRAKEMAAGYESFANEEVPPPSALAGRRRKGDADKEEKRKKSTGLSLWAIWGSKHDEKTMVREAEADKEPETTTASSAQGANARPLHDMKTRDVKNLGGDNGPYSRSRSRRRTVTDQNQTGENVNENTSAADLLALRISHREKDAQNNTIPSSINNKSENFKLKDVIPSTLLPLQQTTENAEMDPTIDLSKQRPKANGIAFPFKLKRSDEAGLSSNASLATLTSVVGVEPTDDVRVPGAMSPGLHDSVHCSEKGSISGFAPKNDEEKVAARPDTAETEDGIMMRGDGKKAVQNGEVVNASRPQLDSFVTASEDLPKAAEA
jgi:hypothetical protein